MVGRDLDRSDVSPIDPSEIGPTTRKKSLLVERNDWRPVIGKRRAAQHARQREENRGAQDAADQPKLRVKVAPPEGQAKKKGKDAKSAAQNFELAQPGAAGVVEVPSFVRNFDRSHGEAQSNGEAQSSVSRCDRRAVCKPT